GADRGGKSPSRLCRLPRGVVGLARISTSTGGVYRPQGSSGCAQAIPRGDAPWRTTGAALATLRPSGRRGGRFGFDRRRIETGSARGRRPTRGALGKWRRGEAERGRGGERTGASHRQRFGTAWRRSGAGGPAASHRRRPGAGQESGPGFGPRCPDSRPPATRGLVANSGSLRVVFGSSR